MREHVEYQRQAVGEKLMHEFERQLSEAGFKGVNLQAGMEMPARNFYEKLGRKPLSLITLVKALRIAD